MDMWVSIYNVTLTIRAEGYWYAYHELRTAYGRSRWNAIWLVWVAHNNNEHHKALNF